MMRLNLGSGHRKIDGYINIDCRDLGQELVLDIVKHGLPFDDGAVAEVRAYDFLEHIPIGKTISVIEEIWRVLVSDGLFEHMTPSTDGRGAWQDPTHVSFWNINSWMYYMDDQYRELYGIIAKFRGTNKDYIDEKLMIIHTHGELYAVK